ncbi:uncharacterized protein H6S33_010037 [Morchella sextelata]|uniref:uncharacterized protein n=1 Tax=Morchella sextelata TaxID=1174677 RepID=UPI001D04B9E3|nr:uncharacterized protein H6S33_010037 [Morchella sextelata]KAH0611985.1 hypothetical protein H6S33_010037 [Morchella sextelata]
MAPPSSYKLYALCNNARAPTHKERKTHSDKLGASITFNADAHAMQKALIETEINY